MAQKYQQQEYALFIVLFVLILCHVKEAYLPHKIARKCLFDVAQKYQEQENAPLKIKLTQSYY